MLKAMGCDLVQGYHLSKPVPPQEFDRFLVERLKAKVVMPTPTSKKTYLTVSRALTGDFETIFYVDVVTGYYLEFYTNVDGGLGIGPGGSNFYGDVPQKLLSGVCEPDVEKVREATSKAALAEWVGEEGRVVSFQRVQAGEPTPYVLQAIKTRESDSCHIVIGMRQW